MKTDLASVFFSENGRINGEIFLRFDLWVVEYG